MKYIVENKVFYDLDEALKYEEELKLEEEKKAEVDKKKIKDYKTIEKHYDELIKKINDYCETYDEPVKLKSDGLFNPSLDYFFRRFFW